MIRLALISGTGFSQLGETSGINLNPGHRDTFVSFHPERRCLISLDIAVRDLSCCALLIVLGLSHAVTGGSIIISLIYLYCQRTWVQLLAMVSMTLGLYFDVKAYLDHQHSELCSRVERRLGKSTFHPPIDILRPRLIPPPIYCNPEPPTMTVMPAAGYCHRV